MRIALCGYSRSGKDTAGRALIEDGFIRVCFGDIIKRQLDDLCRFHLGYSAFTEDDSRKAAIRPLLETWGDCNYGGICNEFFDNLPEHCVNTRLVRLREAKEWVARGGFIVEIAKTSLAPATQWEQVALEELDRAGLIHYTVYNDSTIDDLHAAIRECTQILSTCAAFSPKSTTAPKTPPDSTANAPLTCGN
jgi:hypothetical protein